MSEYKKASAFFADMRRQHKDAKQSVIVREIIRDCYSGVAVDFMLYNPRDDIFSEFGWIGPREELDALRTRLVEMA